MLDTKDLVERYVPHSGGMLLIDRVLEYSPDFIITEIDIGSHLPCYSEGKFPAYMGLEIMAQSIAVWSGIGRNCPGPNQPLGFLLGTRKYECAVAWFEVGLTLRVHARQILQNEGLASFECTLGRVNEEHLAKANVNVYSVGVV